MTNEGIDSSSFKSSNIKLRELLVRFIFGFGSKYTFEFFLSIITYPSTKHVIQTILTCITN